MPDVRDGRYMLRGEVFQISASGSFGRKSDAIFVMEVKGRKTIYTAQQDLCCRRGGFPLCPRAVSQRTALRSTYPFPLSHLFVGF